MNSPAFQFYPKQIMGDDKVIAMDWDARGMHFWLLGVSWQQDEPGTLPDDTDLIRRWLGSPSDDVWRRVRPQVLSAWPIRQDGRRFNPGLCRSWESQQKRSKANVANVRIRYQSPTNGIQTPLKIETEKELEVELKIKKPHFAELIYESYPRKVHRADAIKAINKAILRVMQENKCADSEAAKLIHEAVLEFAKSPAGNRGTYTKHCASWMNAEGYLDNREEWYELDREEFKALQQTKGRPDCPKCHGTGQHGSYLSPGRVVECECVYSNGGPSLVARDGD